MKNKFLVLFIITIFSFFGFSLNVYAEENLEVYCDTVVNHRDLIQNQKNVVDNWESIEKTLKARPANKKFLATPGVNTDLESVIVNAVKNRETFVRVDNFGLTLSNFNTDAFTYVLNDYPELFYCSGIITYFDTVTNEIVAIAPHYIYDESQTATIQASLDIYTENVFANIDTDMNDLEKLMVAHDFVVKTCDYNYEDLNNGSLQAEDFNIVGVLDGQAVCQGYTMMLKYLLNKMNIESTYVYSVAMNHIWNAVKINGKYYHVDATWTDPGDDYFAEVNRKYFLKGNNYFLNKADHYSWECGVSEFGTAYDDYFWNSNKYFFAYIEDYWYYKKNQNTVVKIDLRNDLTMTDIVISNLSTYSSNPCLASDGKHLYCIDNDFISRINLNNLEITEYFTIDLDNGDYLEKMTNLTPNIILFSYVDGDWNIGWFEVYPITGIELSEESVSINEGETKNISWKILPENFTDGYKIKITTSNKNVATVSTEGVITGVTPGTAIITITINDEYTDSLTVTVTEKKEPVVLIGDVDNDGRVSVRDARLVVQNVVGLKELNNEEKARADIDGNSKISVRDARKILEIALGK